MELYILDSLLRRTEVIDKFESLVWTDRWRTHGDFQLVVVATPENKSRLMNGTRLAMNESYRVMTVETVNDVVDEEGRALLKIVGPSLEALMDDRAARPSFTPLDIEPKWVLEGPPADVARAIFDDNCRSNVNFPEDDIPFLQPGNLFPPGNIPEPSEEIVLELELQSVYTAMVDLCETFDLGFRIVRNFDTSELYHEVYSGNDRTASQSVFAPVVFSPTMDNLTNTSYIQSIEDAKNVAYVFHNFTTQIVYAEGVNPNVEGFERKVMSIDATDITVPERPYEVTEAQDDAISIARRREGLTDQGRDALDKLAKKIRLNSVDKDTMARVWSWELDDEFTSAVKNHIQTAYNTSVAYEDEELSIMNALLQDKGKSELAKHRTLQAFDGELTATSQYVHDIHFQIGDLVDMRSADGTTNQMRVSEIIFSSDAEGERRYPTLTLAQFISSESWAGWNFNDTWATADGTWAEA